MASLMTETALIENLKRGVGLVVPLAVVAPA